MGNFFGDFIDAVTGNDHSTENHDDGSYTDRYNGTDTSVTYNSDNTVREYSESESTFFGGVGDRIQVTYDGDGNINNVQSRND